MSRKFALIIGNNEYNDPRLPPLTAPVKDVEEFARVLKDPLIGAFDSVNVITNAASSLGIEVIDEFFDEKKPDDLLVLYFSGHGIKDEFGSLYLAFKNTLRSRLRATAIKSDYIRDAMDQSRSKRQVLILDCCNSGAFSQGAKSEVGGVMGLTTAFQGFGRFVLTASNSIQIAWEGNRLLGEAKTSLFTHFLVKGLEGDADLDGDGVITVDDIYDYTYEEINRLTPDQTPTKSATKQEGEIVLRRITRMEDIKPVSLPKELLEAIEDTRTFVREGAVQQLEKLLKGRNLGLAKSAREALEKMANEDDSRRVSQAAAQVLDAYRQLEEKSLKEQRAREEAKRLAILREEEERAAREKEEFERKVAEETERLLRAQAEREAAEQEAARLKAEREAEEKAALELAERAARDKAEKDAVDENLKTGLEDEKPVVIELPDQSTVDHETKKEVAVKRKVISRSRRDQGSRRLSQAIALALIGMLAISIVSYFANRSKMHANETPAVQLTNVPSTESTQMAMAIATHMVMAESTETAIVRATTTAIARVTGQAKIKSTTTAGAVATVNSANEFITTLTNTAKLVFGPSQGSLNHNGEDDTVSIKDARIYLKDFIAKVTFHNPFSTSTGSWDYGLTFRDYGRDNQYRLVFDSKKHWTLENWSGSSDNVKTIKSGNLTNFNINADGKNTVVIYCKGDKGILVVNDKFITELDLSSRTTGGTILIGTGFYGDSEITGQSTEYEDFNVWKIP